MSIDPLNDKPGRIAGYCKAEDLVRGSVKAMVIGVILSKYSTFDCEDRSRQRQ